MHSSTVAKSILNHPSAATNRAAAQSVIGRAPRLRWFALRQEIPHRVYCLLAAAGFIAVFALWAWLSHQPFVKRVFLPTPETVWETARVFLPDENLWTDVKVSVMRVTAGFLLAAALALPLGIWMDRSKRLKDCCSRSPNRRRTSTRTLAWKRRHFELPTRATVRFRSAVTFISLK